MARPIRCTHTTRTTTQPLVIRSCFNNGVEEYNKKKTLVEEKSLLWRNIMALFVPINVITLHECNNRITDFKNL